MERSKKSTSTESSSTRESESESNELDLTFDEIIAICIAKFNMTYTQAMRCTPRQFEIEMIAYRLRRQEFELNNRLNAYYTMAVQSTKNNGKEMLYKNFNDFYDVEEEFEQALRPNTNPKRNNNRKLLSMAEINRRLAMQKGGNDGK